MEYGTSNCDFKYPVHLPVFIQDITATTNAVMNASNTSKIINMVYKEKYI